MIGLQRLGAENKTFCKKQNLEHICEKVILGQHRVMLRIVSIVRRKSWRTSQIPFCCATERTILRTIRKATIAKRIALRTSRYSTP